MDGGADEVDGKGPSWAADTGGDENGLPLFSNSGGGAPAPADLPEGTTGRVLLAPLRTPAAPGPGPEGPASGALRPRSAGSVSPAGRGRAGGHSRQSVLIGGGSRRVSARRSVSQRADSASGRRRRNSGSDQRGERRRSGSLPSVADGAAPPAPIADPTPAPAPAPAPASSPAPVADDTDTPRGLADIDDQPASFRLRRPGGRRSIAEQLEGQQTFRSRRPGSLVRRGTSDGRSQSPTPKGRRNSASIAEDDALSLQRECASLRSQLADMEKKVKQQQSLPGLVQQLKALCQTAIGELKHASRLSASAIKLAEGVGSSDVLSTLKHLQQDSARAASSLRQAVAQWDGVQQPADGDAAPAPAAPPCPAATRNARTQTGGGAVHSDSDSDLVSDEEATAFPADGLRRGSSKSQSIFEKSLSASPPQSPGRQLSNLPRQSSTMSQHSPLRNRLASLSRMGSPLSRHTSICHRPGSLTRASSIASGLRTADGRDEVGMLVRKLLVEVGLSKVRGFVVPFLSATAALNGVDSVACDVEGWLDERRRAYSDAPKHFGGDPGIAEPGREDVLMPAAFTPPASITDPFRMVSAMRWWRTPQGAVWPIEAIDDLVNDCHFMAAQHAAEQASSVAIPIFVHTSTIYSRVVWALWSVDGVGGDCWVNAGAFAAALQRSFDTGGGTELALHGPARGEVLDGVSLACLDARKGRAATQQDREVPMTIPAATTGDGHVVFTHRSLSVVRFENVDRGSYDSSPFCSSVCWLPPPADLAGESPFSVFGRLPPPGLLEYLSSRPYSESRSGQTWVSHPIADTALDSLLKDCHRERNTMLHVEEYVSRLKQLTKRPEQFSFVRLVPVALRSDDAEAVQLSCLQLFGEKHTDPPAGRKPATALDALSEEPLRVIAAWQGAVTGQPPALTSDGPGNAMRPGPRRWRDRGRRPLVFELEKAYAVAAYRIQTPPDRPECDPVEWELEGATSSQGPWWVLHTHRDRRGVSDERLVWTPMIRRGGLGTRVPSALLRKVTAALLPRERPTAAAVAEAASLQYVECGTRKHVLGLGHNAVAADVGTRSVTRLWRVACPHEFQPAQIITDTALAVSSQPHADLRRVARLHVVDEDPGVAGTYTATVPDVVPVVLDSDTSKVRTLAEAAQVRWDDFLLDLCGKSGEVDAAQLMAACGNREPDGPAASVTVRVYRGTTGMHTKLPVAALTPDVVAMKRRVRAGGQRTALWQSRRERWELSSAAGGAPLLLPRIRCRLHLDTWLADEVRVAAWALARALERLPAAPEATVWRWQRRSGVQEQGVVRWLAPVAATPAREVCGEDEGSIVVQLRTSSARAVAPWARRGRERAVLIPSGAIFAPVGGQHTLTVRELEEIDGVRALEVHLLGLLPGVRGDGAEKHVQQLLSILHEAKAGRMTQALHHTVDPAGCVLQSAALPALVRQLTLLGADTSLRDRSLERAALDGHERVVMNLIDGGADPSASLAGGDTALHAAAKGGHLLIAKLLVDAGADASATDTAGLTPLHYAQTQHHVPLQTLLAAAASGISKAARADQSAVPITVGDSVRVRVAVAEPRFGWRGVAHGDVGVVTRCLPSGNTYVNFPRCRDWFGKSSDLEAAGD